MKRGNEQRKGMKYIKIFSPEKKKTEVAAHYFLTHQIAKRKNSVMK